MNKNNVSLLVIVLLLFTSCNDFIKNDDVKVVVEEGTKIDTLKTTNKVEENSILGIYVGMFEVNDDDSNAWKKNIQAGEAFYWERENKISIFIDNIASNTIKGHSVVAGNERPFEGTITKQDSLFIVEAKEPGTNKNDGIFNFTIKDTVINGTWKAFAKIEISNRKYELVRKEFKYNPQQLLDANKRYVDWTKPELDEKQVKAIKANMSEEDRLLYEEFEENTNFASATTKIYTLNASATLLTEKQVANLSKGDLSIIRNTIYARHGYSFKNRPIRVFFDRQTWYIPVNTNIKNEFTEIEKKNIELLLRYEKVAKEYYDYFGRG